VKRRQTKQSVDEYEAMRRDGTRQQRYSQVKARRSNSARSMV
jgi:hypothetical protein